MTDENQLTDAQTQANDAAYAASVERAQDQAAVAAAEAKIEEDAANIAPDQNAVAVAVTELETIASAAEAASASPGSGLDATVEQFDRLTDVIAAGITQYDGYPEHADKVSSLRELQQFTAGMSTSTRNMLADTIKGVWGATT